MLKRKIIDQLVDWKKEKKDECLILNGARQVGKTFIIRVFGSENYKHFIEINFIEVPEMKNVFSGSLSSDDILKQLSAKIPYAEFVPGETLLFLDEIQVCPKARTALKFLATDKRVDVIASGSLLGMTYGSQDVRKKPNEFDSIPVGYEFKLEMTSLDFEEFLWANGIKSETIDYLRGFFESGDKVPPVVNEQFLKLIREYMVVGGMPEAVQEYIETQNFGKVHQKHKKILNSYLEDIVKFATLPERPKIKNAFLSIPKQLAKESKKFQYSVAEKGATSRKYSNSLEWLRDAYLINFCYNVSTPGFPISAYERNIEDVQFKIYMSDIGLLVYLYGFEMIDAILSNDLTGPVKGGVYENLIADIFAKKGYNLNYFKTENSTQEIEFLLTKNKRIVPIEVKAGRGQTMSLNNFIAEYNPPIAYKFVTGNVGGERGKTTLPHYMAMFI